MPRFNTMHYCLRLSTLLLLWIPVGGFVVRYPSDKLRVVTRRARNEEQDQAAVITSVNVLGTPLESCCSNVRGTGIGTGFYGNGFCCTGEQDLGRHTVCVQVTESFLEFSKSVGNDLSTPVPQYM